MTTAFVALGSNLGDRRAHLDHALRRLGDLGTILDGSPIYETTPVGGPGGQDRYLNAVVSIDTELAPHELLEHLLDVEQERGRVRDERWGPRTLDLDLLLHGDANIDQPGLTLPHAEMRNRPFVLIPLTDIEPGLTDGDGAFVDALGPDAYEGVRRLTGPVDVDDLRWRRGIAESTQVASDFTVYGDPDWSNASGDLFGAFLGVVALKAADTAHPGFAPSQMTYRYMKPIFAGATIELDVECHRASDRARDLTVKLSVDGDLTGLCSMGLVASPRADVVGPPVPAVHSRSEGFRGDRLVAELGRRVGNSVRSWTPFERWDLQEVDRFDRPVFRAWSPHVAVGWDDPYLEAGSLYMPIDAMIWRATMQALGEFPSGHFIATPTIEIAARFARTSGRPWFVSQARLDHRVGRTVAGTVRVWDDTGDYLAVGHSMNLVLPSSSSSDAT